MKARPEVTARSDSVRGITNVAVASRGAFWREPRSCGAKTLGIVPVEVYRQRRAEFIAAHEEAAHEKRTKIGLRFQLSLCRR